MEEYPNQPVQPESRSTHSRREFLQKGITGAGALGVGGFLATHGLPDLGRREGPATRTSPEAAKPKRGGKLRLASSGGGAEDTLDANAAVNNLDFARAPQLYDTLCEFNAKAEIVNALAEEVTPNSTATEWTIRVRSGVLFHNGKEMTIDDVLYTFNRIVTKSLSGASGLAYMNLKAAKKLDKYTVKIPMHRGYSILPMSFLGNGEMSIVPVGYNPKNPVGTGAFKFKSFQPGVQSVFTRNDHYWRSGEPYVDEVVIIDYQDESSQDNALISGQADLADQLSIASVNTLRGQGKVVKIWEGPGWVPFTMRLDSKPFNNVNVRQALRLLIDRPQTRTEVFGGHGLIGNDLFGINGADYDSALPQRHYDPAQAKHLLKKAGHENLSVTLVTAPIKTGATEMAQVFKQNASAGGVTINLSSLSTTAFFARYLKWPFSQDWWSGYPYLRQVGYSMVPGAPWDETHWDTSPYGARYLSLYKQALSTTNAMKQRELAYEMQKMDYNDGGYVIPVFNPVIAGQGTNVRGAADQKTGDPWVEYHLRTLWLA